MGNEKWMMIQCQICYILYVTHFYLSLVFHFYTIMGYTQEDDSIMNTEVEDYC